MRAILFVSVTNKCLTKLCEFRYSHSTARLSIKFLNIGIESFLAGLSQISSFFSL